MTGKQGGVGSVLLRPDVLAGLMFVVVGTLGVLLGRDLEMGTAVQMGAGYVPRLVSLVLIGLGVAIAIGGLLQSQPRVDAGEGISWRSMLLVPAAVFAFGCAIERVGLVLAILVAVAIAGTAARGQHPLGVASAAAFLVVMCTAIFVWGLGLPFSIWLPDR